MKIDLIKKAPILKPIKAFFKKRDISAFIVGGFIRDILLKRKKENLDIDIALEKNSLRLAKALAKKIKAGYVALDDAHGTARLFKTYKQKNYTVDFTDFRGRNLKEDLECRDFSLNAIAIDLFNQKEFIDFYHGREDIQKKTIRVLRQDTFDEDPLRILRAFSLSCMLGFKIEPQTKKLAFFKKEKLSQVSAERIRDELFKILEQNNAAFYLEELDNLGILSVVLPEIEALRGVKQGPYHHLDVWKHTLETLRQLEMYLDNIKSKDMRIYLNEIVSSGRKRLALIKLAALLHDIGKPQSMKREGKKIIFHGHEKIGRNLTRQICLRLKLSNEERQMLERIVFLHLRPGYLADSEFVSARAKFRYFRDAGKEAVATLLVSLADQRATKGRLTTRQSRQRHEELVKNLTKEYFKLQKKKKIPRLITGDDLIKTLRLTPSPLFAKILKEIEELQATAEITTKKQALAIARKLAQEEKQCLSMAVK